MRASGIERRITSVRAVCALAAGAALLAPSGARGEAEATPYVVTGRVLKADGQPAAGSRVQYYYYASKGRPGSGVREQVLVGRDGTFRVPNVTREGPWHFLVAMLQDHGMAFATVPTEQSVSPSVGLTLVPETRLSGLVVDRDGKPVVGALAMATSVHYRPDPDADMAYLGIAHDAPFGVLSATTDARGRFSIPHLPGTESVSLSLRVLHPRYAVAHRHFRAENLSQETKIVLVPGGAIEGEISHEGTGAPSAGLGLTAVGKIEGLNVTEMTRSGRNGQYLFSNLSPGTYTLQVSLPADGEWTTEHRAEVSVVAGEVTRDVDLLLIKGAVIAGKVVEAGTGQPVAKAWVGAYARPFSFGAETRLDGTFQVRCPPGSYAVRAGTAPRGYVQPDWDNRRNVTVVAGRDSKPLRFEIVRGLTLVGRAVDIEGRPVPKARVTTRTDKGWDLSERADEAGVFRLHGITPNARLRLFAKYTKAGLGGFVNVHAERDPPSDLVIQLLPLAEIVGRVVDPNGIPVCRQRVSLLRHGDRTSWHTGSRPTDETGRYQFRAVAGLKFSVGITSGPGRVSTPKLTTVAGRRHTMPDIVSSARMTTKVSGRVVDPGGEPVPGALVSVVIDRRHHRAEADQHGKFSFTDLKAGGQALRITASVEEGLLTGQVTVDPKDANAEVVLRLTDSAELAGRVVDERGKPIAEARVLLHVWSDERSYAVGSRTRTDSDGRYQFMGLVPGRRCSVSASAAGYGRLRTRSTLLEDGDLRQLDDIVLPRADSFVAGRVTDVEGNPVTGVHVHCSGRGVSSRGAKTDSQGRFTIEGIPHVERLRLYARCNGYHDERGVARSGSSDANLTMTPKFASRLRVAAAVGRPAPELQIAEWTGGRPVPLDALRGRAVLLHFWTLYSRSCVRSMAALKSLQQQYGDRLAILAIHDRAAPLEEVKEFVKANKIELPVGIVKSTKEDGWAGETFRAYGVKALPCSFLIDPKGVLRYANVSDGLQGKVATLVEE